MLGQSIDSLGLAGYTTKYAWTVKCLNRVSERVLAVALPQHGCNVAPHGLWQLAQCIAPVQTGRSAPESCTSQRCFGWKNPAAQTAPPLMTQCRSPHDCVNLAIPAVDTPRHQKLEVFLSGISDKGVLDQGMQHATEVLQYAIWMMQAI
jgi:hypothetical protein